MKYMLNNFKMLITMVSLCSISFFCNAQTILGTWQLMKETSCLEKEMKEESDALRPLVEDMKNMSSPAAQVVTFKAKGSGEESTRILNRKRTANNKNFLYKFNGTSLLILDKKSQTITDSFTVDKLSGDSLIVSSASRACETRIFIKIRQPKGN